MYYYIDMILSFFSVIKSKKYLIFRKIRYMILLMCIMYKTIVFYIISVLG